MIKQPPYMGVRSYLGASFESAPQIGVIGVPFDLGTTNRPGARFGPEAIRRASLMLCEELPYRVADFGDILSTEVEACILRLLEKKIFPVSLGGDHSITLPILRALKKFYKKPITLCHFDAHPDTWDDNWGDKFGHGSFLYNALKEGLIDEKSSLMMGVRCPLDPATSQFTKEHIRAFFPAEAIHEEGWLPVVKHLEKLKEQPCYLTFDIDVLDPAFAPGTGTPEIGGLSTAQILRLLRHPAFSKLNWIGMDVVEVSPPYDHAEITALAAASIIFYFISNMRRKP